MSSVIPASRITKSLPPGCTLTSTTRVSSAPAGPTMLRPGSRMIDKPEPRTIGSTASAYSCAVGATVPSYEMPRPPPRSRCSIARPVGDEPVGELDDRAGGAPQRLEIHDLRADVGVEADDLDAGAIAHSQAQVARLVDRDAELVGLEAGRNVRMAARVDVRVDADGDAGARLALARDRVDAFELALRLRVDRLDAEVDGLRQLGAGLADAGEHDLRRDEPGAQRDVDLAAGIGVDLAPERPQQPDDRERRVGLERVVHRVRIRRERIVDGAVARRHRRGAVDVERRAMRGGDIDERDAVALECAVLAGEAHR